MKGPIKMQDNYFKCSQNSFKDVYSLTLRKFLYPWVFPKLAATMNNAVKKRCTGVAKSLHEACLLDANYDFDSDDLRNF